FSSFHFLGHDMHIHRRSISQEPVDRGKVQIFSPTALRGSSEYHLRDVLIADDLGHLFSDIFPLRAKNLSTDIFPNTNVLREAALILWILVPADVDVDHVQLGVDSLRHSRCAGNQVLRGWTRANAHAYSFPQREIRSQPLFLQIRLET